MKLQLHTNRRGHLVACQAGGRLLIQFIGIPVLLFGLFMLLGTLSKAVEVFAQGGAGMAAPLSTTLVLLVLAAIVLPLGWWMIFSRHWIVMDADAGEVIEVSDWKVGRKEKRTPIEKFSRVRVAVEELNTSAGNKRYRTYVQQVRLIPNDAAKQASIEIGWLDENAREEAITLATRIGDELKLPVEVADEEQLLLSPGRAQVEKEELSNKETYIERFEYRNLKSDSGQSEVSRAVASLVCHQRRSAVL